MSDHYSLSLFAELFCSALWVLWGTLEGRKVILGTWDAPEMLPTRAVHYVLEQSLYLSLVIWS